MFSHIKELFTRPSGYQISRSVRIRQSASAYFNRTFATPTSNQKMTLSCWVKIGSTSQTAGQLTLLNGGNGTQVNASNSFIQLRSDGTALKLQILCNGGGAATVGGYRTFAPYFRDNSAWYHIILAADTTQATAANRYRAYINGVEITSYTGVDPNQNVSITWLNTAVEHLIGKNNEGGGPVYSDTHITEMYWIDGQQLTPSSFGQTNSQTGVWQPIKYTGTYGTNGFYLNFSDNSNNTATTIGKDYSGNGNNWTPNNISVTAGVTYDSMIDVPTPYADGGNGRGNYCVLNPLDFNSGTVSNGNLQWVTSAAVGNGCFGTFAFDIADSTNKYYWEMTLTSGDVVFGIVPLTTLPSNTSRTGSYSYYTNGNKYSGTTPSAYGASFTSGDVIGVAVGNGIITFYKNNVSQGSAFTGLTGFFKPAIWEVSGTFNANFGQRPFSYTPPTGFVALNTQNLPTPTISNGANYMAATLYTGNGGTQSITNTVNGISFQPDLVWNKARSTATAHNLTDSVRGVQKSLFSNSTAAELASCELTAFNSNGYTLVRDAARAEQNENTVTYVGWQWNAGGSTVTNTSGSISAQVRANATAGFSVVTYTTPASFTNATVGHGLGATPAMLIVKSRGAVGSWPVWQKSLNSTDYLLLNTTDAKATSANMFNGTSSTTFTIGTSGNWGGNTTFVAYCFAEVAGYSKFGSYTGNASTDGPFVYLGFRPRWLMVKNSSAVGSWIVDDSSTNPYNEVGNLINANTSGAEFTTSDIKFDYLSNGFKVRQVNSAVNGSGNTLIFMAFAENPFKYSLAR